jgi:tetratricopeptide (TPR) repeat protein
MLSLQLQAQAPPTQGLIRQPTPRATESPQRSNSASPTPRTTEPALPRNFRVPESPTPENLTAENPATTVPTAPKPIHVTTADPVLQSEPTSAIQSVSYRSTPLTLSPLETPPGWIAVEKSIREKLESCDTMLRRGAVFSARQTCWKGLEELCQVLDLHDPTGKRVDSLRRALVAMREEEDFYRFSDIQLAKPDTISNLCFAHETPVIRNLLSQHGEAYSNINPLIAAQHYRSYARDQLVQACDHHPWGADLLYALGKAFEKQAWEDRSRSALVHQHAELVYQAALETNPNQALAATQLGYVLLQLDRPQEAKAVLVRSLQAKPSQAGLQNLAEAYRRLNDPNSMQLCIAHINQLKQFEQNTQPDIPFTEINARQFAAISPPDTTLMQGSTGGAPNISAQPQSPSRMAAQPTPQSTPESNGSQGWLPSLWR